MKIRRYPVHIRNLHGWEKETVCPRFGQNADSKTSVKEGMEHVEPSSVTQNPGLIVRSLSLP
jgi:hypothetical protein